MSVLVWIWLRNSNTHAHGLQDACLMPDFCFHGYFFFFFFEFIKSNCVFYWAHHRLAPRVAAPLCANISPAYQGETTCVYLSLPAQTDSRLRVLSFFFCGFWQLASDSSVSITAISKPDPQSAKQLETKQHERLKIK